VGTPQFMSPEQASADQVDGRSDLYSLGVVGFYALTGELPFDGPNTQTVLAQQLTRAAPELSECRPDLPSALTAAVQHCLAKNPADRPQSGEAVVEALDAVHAARPEVATAIRLYDQHAQNMVRGLFILSSMTLLLVAESLGSKTDDDAMVLLAFVLAIIAGMARTVVGGAQELLRKGFRYEDVREGVLVIAAEQRDYRASLRGSLADEERRGRRQAGVLLGGLLGVALVWWSLTRLRLALPDGGHRLEPVGIALSGLGVMLVAFAVVTTAADPRRTTPFERLGVRLWTGGVGRLIFRIARRGVRTATGERPPRVARAGAVASATVLTPLALFDSLPKHLRAALDGVRVAISRLESEATALAARETELDAALVEARASPMPVGAPAVLAARHAALVDDLAEARRATGERRALLVSTAENVRLQLIRVRSGLASRDDVLAELRAADEPTTSPAAGRHVLAARGGHA
jgi:serine/threonine-protein kinase